MAGVGVVPGTCLPVGHEQQTAAAHGDGRIHERAVLMRPYARLDLILARRIADFLGDRRGLSAVEFALLLPLMLTLYLGTVEVSNGVAADRKVAITARTVADLAARMTTIHNADMTNILGASSAVIAPYSVANLQVTVSEVSIDNKGNATIVWSDSLNGTAHSVGQAMTIPASLAVPSTSD